MITPETRAEGLAAANRVCHTRLVELAEAILCGAEVEVVEAPTPATLMLQLSSPVGEFCAGEVVVTYAAVRVDGRDGWACVSGSDSEGALAAAVCDAASGNQVAELVEASLVAEAQQRDAASLAAAATGLSLA